MTSADRKEVSKLLSTLEGGGGQVPAELFEQVYSELRKQARAERRRWRGNHSLQTTALVNEAYLKLVNGEHRNWSNRAHFFGVAAKAMRHILISYARRKCAQKRGGGVPVLSLEELRSTLGRGIGKVEERSELLLMLDEALTRLAEAHGRASRVVEYRYFGGMTIEETAELLSVSSATVSRDWALARTWLYRELKRLLDSGHPPHHR